MTELVRSEQAAPALVTKMTWSPRMGIPQEGADTLWERSATRIIEHEDRGDQDITAAGIYRELQADYPELYTGSVGVTLMDAWWRNPDFELYLAFRRQEHVIRTMPIRLQVDKYYSRIMEHAGGELFRRLLQDPDSFSNAQLIKILRESAEVRSMVDKDIKTARGEETGKKGVTINAFQFIQDLPQEERGAAMGYFVKQVMNGDGE